MNKVIKFDNFSTVEKLNEWIKESIIECGSCYPMVRIPGVGNRGVAVDVGANVGGFCVHAKNHFQKIYAFEPEIINYTILQKVKEHYQLDNVEAFNTAIHNKSGVELTLRSYESNHSKEVTCADFVNESFSNIDQKCETISLTDMMEALGLDRINYLKLDCEGSEYDILESFEDYHKIDIIALELHGFYGEERKADLLEKLTQHYAFADLSTNGILSFEKLTEKSPSLEELQDEHIFFMIHRNLVNSDAS